MDQRGNIYIVAGISGSGKGTICNKLIERHPELIRPISVTTRDPRPGERFADHYYFVSKELFRWMADTGQLLEHTEVWAGHHYGSLRLSVEQSLEHGRGVLFELNAHGIDQIRKIFPDTKVVFVKAPSEEEQRLRLELRGTIGDEQDERVRGAETELALANERNLQIIVNGDLGEALQEIEAAFQLPAPE